MGSCNGSWAIPMIDVLISCAYEKDYQKYLWEKDKNLIMHVFVIRYAFIQFCAFLALLPSLNRKKKLTLYLFCVNHILSQITCKS